MALRFLAARPRSEAEVRRRLMRGRFAPEAIEAAIARLKAHELIDDEAFARYWVEQRQTFRPRGARLLQAELRQRGVRVAVGQELDPAADAYRAGLKFTRQLTHLPEQTFRSRMAQRLARRGFEWDVIDSTVERLWREAQ